MPTISGLWNFNSQITKPSAPLGFDGSNKIDVTFVSNSVQYCGIEFVLDKWDSGGNSGDGKIGYILYDEYEEEFTTFFYLMNYHPTYWHNDYDVWASVDFGQTPQTVPEDFYTWFTANATKQGGEEQPPEEEPPTTPAKKFKRLYIGFTRLYIGNAVVSSGGKCFKQLTTNL